MEYLVMSRRDAAGVERGGKLGRLVIIALESGFPYRPAAGLTACPADASDNLRL
jgi:hypothetical protein